MLIYMYWRMEHIVFNTQTHTHTRDVLRQCLTDKVAGSTGCWIYRMPRSWRERRPLE